MVRVPAEVLGPPHHDRPMQVLLIGDNMHTPDNITMIPEVVSVDPGQEVTVSIVCTDPPFTLHEGAPFAQMYVLSGADVTLIPRSRWPRNWELVSPCGTVSGIGGAVNFLRSIHPRKCGGARGANCNH